MKYLSTFSGIGGFEVGIEQAYHQYISNVNTRKIQNVFEGPQCVGYSEIDKYAIEVYQRHFPQHHNYGDITKINAEELPDFDLLVGGFPCQAFSIAGKRGGFEDTRGTMFFELARILRAKQPRLCLFENVKGLLSHDGGKSFSTIIQTLDELGYDCQWQVLNSKNHGVPQNRERVFIIGHLRGTPRPEVFPIGENGETHNGESESQTANTLTANYWKGPAASRPIVQVNNPTHSNDRVYGADGLSPILNTMQGGNRQPFITDPQGRKNKVCKPKPYANTLRANTHGNEQVVNHIRRLTPTECERLQGFPDGWTEGVSDTQRYKTLGNAVTVDTIEKIMQKLL